MNQHYAMWLDDERSVVESLQPNMRSNVASGEDSGATASTDKTAQKKKRTKE